ncbi:hypothetical protein BS17DRAFT_76660 [Gyrodon lividus]|nr:hypothetical protein BS17DRAFT_76660 [Gyrodon lividus]
MSPIAATLSTSALSTPTPLYDKSVGAALGVSTKLLRTSGLVLAAVAIAGVSGYMYYKKPKPKRRRRRGEDQVHRHCHCRSLPYTTGAYDNETMNSEAGNKAVDDQSTDPIGGSEDNDCESTTPLAEVEVCRLAVVRPSEDVDAFQTMGVTGTQTEQPQTLAPPDPPFSTLVPSSSSFDPYPDLFCILISVGSIDFDVPPQIQEVMDDIWVDIRELRNVILTFGWKYDPIPVPSNAKQIVLPAFRPLVIKKRNKSTDRSSSVATNSGGLEGVFTPPSPLPCTPPLVRRASHVVRKTSPLSSPPISAYDSDSSNESDVPITPMHPRQRNLCPGSSSSNSKVGMMIPSPPRLRSTTPAVTRTRSYVRASLKDVDVDSDEEQDLLSMSPTPLVPRMGFGRGHGYVMFTRDDRRFFPPRR